MAMTKLAKVIERVGGYMTDAEVQEAFGVMLDTLEDRSGAIRRQAAQLESAWSEIERLRADIGGKLDEARQRHKDMMERYQSIEDGGRKQDQVTAEQRARWTDVAYARGYRDALLWIDQAYRSTRLDELSEVGLEAEEQYPGTIQLATRLEQAVTALEAAKRLAFYASPLLTLEDSKRAYDPLAARSALDEFRTALRRMAGGE